MIFCDEIILLYTSLWYMFEIKDSLLEFEVADLIWTQCLKVKKLKFFRSGQKFLQRPVFGHQATEGDEVKRSKCWPIQLQ